MPIKRNSAPDLKKVRSAFHLDPETGILTWLITRRLGQRAGSLNKGSGYRTAYLDGIFYREHHIVWFHHYGVWPTTHDIDHKDRVRSNNAISNLREATRQQTTQNRTRHMTKVLPLGVFRYKEKYKKRPYFSVITHNKKRKYLGCFATPEEAARAYRIASVQLCGEFSPFW